jgi:SAM-dependent methyltransferase
VYTGVDNLEVMAEAHNYNGFLIDEVIKNCGTARHIIDFGAGVGTFPLLLKKRGLTIVCIEPDETLRRRLSIDGFQCHPSLDAVPPSSVDFIFTLNVLEHIEDDRAIIELLYSRLKPGGRLYVYTPAFNLLFSSMDQKVGHFRRYTKATLLPQLKAAGFEIENGRYVDSLGFVVSLLYRLVGNKRGELNPFILAFYDRVLFPVSRFLDSFLGAIIGKNLAVTAFRPERQDP